MMVTEVVMNWDTNKILLKYERAKDVKCWMLECVNMKAEKASGMEVGKDELVRKKYFDRFVGRGIKRRPHEIGE